MKTALRLALLLIVLWVPSGAAFACIWDRDTLEAEAKGLPDVIDAIIGRIERYPPLYYSMRLERVADELERTPERLDLYDDAAVAAHRCGHDDEAFAFMRQKREFLNALPANDSVRMEHEYRYLANLGTFYVHRWVREGASREDLTDLQVGRDLIAEAIALNPDAHFGREKYQLMATEWLLDPPFVPEDGEGLYCDVRLDADEEDGEATHKYPLSFVQFGDASVVIETNDQPKTLGFADIYEGLIGLMALGEAWQSVDTLHTLRVAVAIDGRSNLAELAARRLRQLHAEGHHSLHPQGSQDIYQSFWDCYSFVGDQDGLDEIYGKLAAQTAEWRQRREEFILKRLGDGLHPDTHEDFWQGYRELPRPQVSPSLQDKIYEAIARSRFAPVVAIICALSVLLIFSLISALRRRRLPPSGG